MADEASADVRPHLVLDACCIITLAATGEFEGILKALSMQAVVVTHVVRHEALSYIDAAGAEIPIHLNPLLTNGLLIRADVDTTSEAEPELVIALESEKLDAGEARSGAIAINRGWAIATDDKRAIRVISERASDLVILSTPDLLKRWADGQNIVEDQLRAAIQRIRRYTPPKAHSLFEWWQGHAKA
jgi:predicted nucleic acid-binding protein